MLNHKPSVKMMPRPKKKKKSINLMTRLRLREMLRKPSSHLKKLLT